MGLVLSKNNPWFLYNVLELAGLHELLKYIVKDKKKDQPQIVMQQWGCT